MDFFLGYLLGRNTRKPEPPPPVPIPATYRQDNRSLAAKLLSPFATLAYLVVFLVLCAIGLGVFSLIGGAGLYVLNDVLAFMDRYATDRQFTMGQRFLYIGGAALLTIFFYGYLLYAFKCVWQEVRRVRRESRGVTSAKKDDINQMIMEAEDHANSVRGSQTNLPRSDHPRQD